MNNCFPEFISLCLLLMNKNFNKLNVQKTVLSLIFVASRGCVKELMLMKIEIHQWESIREKEEFVKIFIC